MSLKCTCPGCKNYAKTVERWNEMLTKEERGKLISKDMTNEEILQKAIDKTVANGYDNKDANYHVEMLSRIIRINPVSVIKNYQEIIYSHDFAKALWGDGKQEDGLAIPTDTILRNQSLRRWLGTEGCKYFGPLWQYHLQNMVISDEPIKYLEANM